MNKIQLRNRIPDIQLKALTLGCVHVCLCVEQVRGNLSCDS